MILEDLLQRPNGDLTPEELEKKIKLLKSLRSAPVKTTSSGKVKKPGVRKTNKDKQLDDLIKQLTPDQLATLLKNLAEENG